MVVTLFVAQMIVTHIRSMASSTMPLLSHAFQAVQFSFIIAANALLFGMVYKWLPKKEVGWNEALRGGLLAAVIWELGRVILGAFLIGMQYTSAYGVIGSFIAILLWCYYGMSIVFFGAEYVQVLQRRKAERQILLAAGDKATDIESLSDGPAAIAASSSSMAANSPIDRPRIRPRNRQSS